MIGFILYFGRKWYYKGKTQPHNSKKEVLSEDDEDETILEAM